jgi:hypothetical protein
MPGWSRLPQAWANNQHSRGRQRCVCSSSPRFLTRHRVLSSGLGVAHDSIIPPFLSMCCLTVHQVGFRQSITRANLFHAPSIRKVCRGFQSLFFLQCTLPALGLPCPCVLVYVCMRVFIHVSTFCVKTACIGETDASISLCAAGYSGNLCASCVTGYGRTSDYFCAECPERAGINWMIFVVLILIGVINISIGTYSSLQVPCLFSLREHKVSEFFSCWV